MVLAIVIFAMAITVTVVYRPAHVLCTYAGSPYLDPGIPDECEQGQGPQPGIGECGVAGNTRCIDPNTGKYPGES